MNKSCDEKVIKALIYALGKDRISCEIDMNTREVSFEVDRKGVKEQIRTIEGNLINDKNIAKLISWMRNEDELIEVWSAEYDKLVKFELNSLPECFKDEEVRGLETKISRTEFMSWLRGRNGQNKLFTLKTFNPANETMIENNLINILEFAYLVKNNNSESNDAECILRVAYQTFLEYCNHKTPMSSESKRFIKVYWHQLSQVYKAVAEYVCTSNEGTEYENYFNQFATWLNSCGSFMHISFISRRPFLPVLNEFGEIVIDDPVDIDNVVCETPGGVIDIIENYKNSKKRDIYINEDDEII